MENSNVLTYLTARGSEFILLPSTDLSLGHSAKA